MRHVGSVRDNNRPGTASAVRDLLAVIETMGAEDDIPPALRARIRRLGRDVAAGVIPVAEAQDEVRALFSGLALRAKGVGTRCCQVADVLVGELTRAAGVRWDGIAVPGAADRSNARTGLIELLFPAADFWGIAAAVHEVGHVLAQESRLGNLGYNPARRIIDEREPAGQREELFCDFYATYVLGPAFPAFMILEGLEPAEENSTPAVATHPGARERVFVMMRTLEYLDTLAGQSRAPYRHARVVLESVWRDQDTGPADDGFLTNFTGRLCVEVAPAVGDAFTTPMAARFIADDLAGDGPLPSTANLRALDVVGAAWGARIDTLTAEPTTADHIATRALALLDRIVLRQEGAGDGQR